MEVGTVSQSRVGREVRVHADSRFVEIDLESWAGARIARVGRRDALLGRVETLRLSVDGRAVEARVRGNRPLPYRTQVTADAEGLSTSCTCSRAGAGPCRHAVAAVETLRFPRSEPRRTGGRRNRGGRAVPGRGRIVRPGTTGPGLLIVGGTETTRSRDERIDQAREEELILCRQRARRERLRVTRRTESAGLSYEVTHPRSGTSHTVTLRGTGATGI